jgi:Na+-translocating ferredoxin:NAD+ oxidoreductase RnfA subunit
MTHFLDGLIFGIGAGIGLSIVVLVLDKIMKWLE